jgi:hypothetical protein
VVRAVVAKLQVVSGAPEGRAAFFAPASGKLGGDQMIVIRKAGCTACGNASCETYDPMEWSFAVAFVEAFNRLDGNDVEPVEADDPF